MARKSPNRYCREGDGPWRCPPGAVHAARFGLYYRLRSSAEIDWTLQRNIQYLEDYWRFDAVDVAPGIRETVQAEVAAAPGLLLTYLVGFMECRGIQKLEGLTSTLSLRGRPPSVHVYDENEVPAEFKRTKMETIVDKTAVKVALKAGQTVPGALLVTGRHTLQRR